MLYIGTAGWSYKDWVPGFYPKTQTGGFDWLSFYARYFNCVEVNATYYAYMDPKIVQGWINKTEDAPDFTFTIKLHQDFTHKRQFDNQKINAVNYNLNMLNKASRLGGLLIQFPYSFSYSEPAAEYLLKLKDIFDAYPLFVEVRHNSWLAKEPLQLFHNLNLSYTTIDQPQIGEAVDFKPLITGGRAYIRFHGRNFAEWGKSISSYGKKQTYDQQNERYRYLYSPGEILETVNEIKPLIPKAHEIFVIMNNHPSANAVANAFEFMSHLENRKVDIPHTTLSQFPRLKSISTSS